MPSERSKGTGRFVKTFEAAERRRLAAEARSRGVKWQDIADQWYRGDLRNAGAAVSQFWAEQPRQTVEEIRTAMVAKLEGLEELARGVMARPHYVVAEGRIVVEHRDDCEMIVTTGDGRPRVCRCPKLIDDKPIYDGIDKVRQLVETQLKLIPGLAAPKRMEVLDDDAIAREIELARADLQREAEELAARRIADRAAAGDAGGTGDTAEGSG